jgi:hypothetical protein
MERSSKIAQAYGYAVCFIAVITMLICVKNIIDASFDLSAPLRADRYGMGISVSSFETYKRDRIERGATTRPTPGPNGTVVQQPRTYTDDELRKMYESDRADQIDNVRFRATRSLVSNLILVVLAVGLFLTHWRWLRREDIRA